MNLKNCFNKMFLPLLRKRSKTKGERMKEYDWFDKIDKAQFETPVIVKNDCDYLPGLTDKLSLFTKELSSSGVDSSIASEIKEYADSVLNILNQYYQGNIMAAQEYTSRLLSSFCSAPAVTLVNNCPAFYPFEGSENIDVNFFRARLSDNVTVFPADEMLHIPFNNRGLIKSERFSIPGLPCLYLANTSYCCWIEMGSPADHRFNVAPFVLDNTQKILNLTFAMHEIYNILYQAKEGIISLDNKYISDLFKLFILTLSTSYKVETADRHFKSEYILSQLIMLAAKNMGIDGISYLSKQVSNDLFASVAGVNVVLFATYNGEEKHSRITDHLETDDSFNFSMFKQLLPCQKYKKPDLRIDGCPYSDNIGSFSRQFPYKETEFYEFDKYIFANWKGSSWK